ncbi:putative toxin [Coprobacter fastidiosus]|uniref:putative toxin n=1 Tax=Coprobacter fastidiosus TaxID=1099853 RepID=UPI00241D9E6F|nr:putative toxin [Coprobacter fastidiosus]
MITEHGLNRYDSKARIQDFQIPGFTTLDLLCENYYGILPYAYCAGNPVRYVDPTGRWIESLWDVASLTIGAKSFVENVRQGNVKASVVDGLGMLVDLGAVILPGVPGGAGVAIKTGRTADKTAETLKAMERRRQSEKRALQEMRATKNTKREMTTLETGEDITVIPDIVTPKNIMEIKDVKIVNNTKQIRGERQVAKDTGKEFKIITGEKTHVSGNIPEREIIRRKDLGPKKNKILWVNLITKTSVCR